MTVGDFYNEILSVINEPVNLLTVRRRLNEAIDVFSTLYERMFLKSKTTIVCNNTDTYYDIPADSIGISKILDNENYKYTHFELFNNTIKFKDTGTYTVIYTVKANLTVTKDSRLLKSEDINVNQLFLRAIIYYVLATVENNANKSASYMEVANSLAKEANFMAAKQNSSKIKKIKTPVWR